MSISEVWAIAEPYVIAFISFLVSSGVLAVIGKLIAGKVTNKINSEKLAEDITTKVIESIVNTDVKVSLESVNKAQMEDISIKLNKGNVANNETLHKQNLAIIAMGRVLLHLKASTEEEKIDLLNTINALEEDDAKIELPVDNVVTVNIQPVPDKSNTNKDTYNGF